MKKVLAWGVILSICAVLYAQKEEDDQIKKLTLKKKKIKLEVGYESKPFELDPTPILDYIPNKGTLIEGCVIQQGELIENPALTNSFVGKFPVSMHNRWHTWLNFKDGQFFIYREDKFKPFTITSLSRAGMLSDNLDVDLSLISGKEGDQIKFMRDTAQDNGPSANRTVSAYIYIEPKVIVYLELNFLGKSVKTKSYETDTLMNVVDSFALNKKMYVATGGSLEVYTVNENMMIKDKEIMIPVNSVRKIGFTRGKLFLFVTSADGKMELVANNKFSLENAYVHLKAKSIDIFDSGNRNLVIFAQDDAYADRGTYYYIENPKANKSSSLVFEKIPEIKKRYKKVFELKGRIHFILDTEHAMYTKGSKKISLF